MRYIVTAFLLLICPLLAHSQTILTGKVVSATDSVAVGWASVMVEGGRPNAMCNAEGIFVLNDVPQGEIVVEVHMLGFHSVTFKKIIKPGHNDAGTIKLVETLSEIDAVVITTTPQMAVQKGDTTQFNAAAFKTHPDAEADELLMKMPGVIIQDGRIEAQGEPVRRIYVDGKLFFSTDPMAALKSLPADAVESIQLFDDVSEETRFTGFDDGETVKAINIVTKTKSKETVIVRAETSAGSETNVPSTARYLTGGNFSYFNDKHRITVTGLFNNVNTSKFGQSDLDGAGIDDNGNPVNQPAGIRKIGGAGANYSFENKGVKLSANYFYDNNRNTIERLAEVNYYPKPPSFDSKNIYRTGLNKTHFQNHRFNARLEWSVNPRNTILFNPRFNQRYEDNTNNTTSLTIHDGDSLSRNHIVTPAETSSYSFGATLMWTHRFKKRGRAITTNLNYSGSGRENDRYQHYELNQNYRNNNWVTPNTVTNRTYDQDTRNNSASVKVTYSEPVAAKHRLLFNASAGREWGSDDKQVVKYNQHGELIDKDRSQSSNFSRDYSSYGGGIGYSFQDKKYRFSAGADYILLDQERDEKEPNEVTTNRSFRDLRPNAMLRYTMNKSRYLRFNYQGRTILPRIDFMQDVIDDSAPSNVRIGNPNLKQGYQHRITLFYNSTNKEKNSNFTFTLEGRTISNYIAQSTESIDGDSIFLADRGQWYVPKNSGAFISRYENLDGYVFGRTEATYSFALKAIKSNINITVNYNYVRSPSVYTELNYANIHKTGIRLGITSNVSENVDFNFYSHTLLSNTVNSSRENTSYTNQNFYLSTNIIFAGDMVMNTLFSWRYYSSSGLSSFDDSFFLLNVGLGRKILAKRNGEIRVTAYDLLNQNKNLQHYVRNTNTEDVRTNTLGRYVLARFMYRFNSLSHGRAAQKKKIAGDNYQSIGVDDLKDMPKNN